MTIPSGVQNGDIGIIVASNPQKILPTTPTGWMLLGMKFDQAFASGSTIIVSVYKRKMLATDAGTTVTIALPGSPGADCMIGGGIIIAGGSDVGTIALAADSFSTLVNPTPNNIDFPSVVPGPQDLVLLFGATRTSTSTTLTDAELASGGNPTGSTVQLNTANQNNSIQFAFGIFLLTGSASSFNNQTTQGTLPNTPFARIGGALTISPAGRKPTASLPSSLMGGNLFGYGESYLTWADVPSTSHGNGNTPNQNYYHMSESIYFQRLKNGLRSSGYALNDLQGSFGIGGAWAADSCGFAYGTVVYYTQVGISADSGWAIHQAGTWVPVTGSAGASTLVMLEMMGDDALNDPGPGASAKSLAGATNATDALIRLLRCSSIVADTDASITYGGTWTHNTSYTDVANNSCHYAIGSPGSQPTITIATTHSDIDLILLAQDDTATGSPLPGAPFTITVDGNPWAPPGFPTTTSNQMRQSSDGQYAQSVHTQMAIPCHNMGAGSHTIVITHAGTSGQNLGFNCYLVQAASPPPWVVLMKIPPTLNYTAIQTVAPNVTSAVVAAYNAAYDTIGSRFTDGRLLVFDYADLGRNPAFNYATMLNNEDNVHPYDQGAAFQFHNLATFLSERIP